MRKILDGPAIEQAVSRLAREILAKHEKVDELVLIGIRTRGVPLARRLAGRITVMEKVDVPVGVLDITLYRDDFTTVGSQPIVRKTEIPFPITDRGVVLVDDVLYTGRTIRAALDGLVDHGRPRRIQLAVLVDRGHRELPIRADFIGKTVATKEEEFVQVNLKETDKDDSVYVGELGAGRAKAKRVAKE